MGPVCAFRACVCVCLKNDTVVKTFKIEFPSRALIKYSNSSSSSSNRSHTYSLEMCHANNVSWGGLSNSCREGYITKLLRTGVVVQTGTERDIQRKKGRERDFFGHGFNYLIVGTRIQGEKEMQKLLLYLGGLSLKVVLTGVYLKGNVSSLGSHFSSFVHHFYSYIIGLTKVIAVIWQHEDITKKKSDKTQCYHDWYNMGK